MHAEGYIGGDGERSGRRCEDAALGDSVYLDMDAKPRK